ncbi:cryptochrome/photolyase family protein, partial [bacterium]
MRTIWILGDQLMADHPALAGGPHPESVVLMIESHARGAVHRYHQVKLALVYAAMRHRAAGLRAAGWRVDYHALTSDDTADNRFEPTLRAHCERFGTTNLAMAEPHSLRERSVVQRLAELLGLPLTMSPGTQFLLTREAFAHWARGRRTLLMEDHYREMRRRFGWLMTATGDPA